MDDHETSEVCAIARNISAKVFKPKINKELSKVKFKVRHVMLKKMLVCRALSVNGEKPPRFAHRQQELSKHCCVISIISGITAYVRTGCPNHVTDHAIKFRIDKKLKRVVKS